MITYLKNHNRILYGAVAVMAVLAAVVIIGVQVHINNSVYAIVAGCEEVVYVENGDAAERVVSDVVKEYTPEGAQVNSISVDRKVSTVPVSSSKVDEEQVMTEDEAVKYIIKQNDSDDPCFCVTINADMSEVKDLKAYTTYKDDSSMYEDQTVVTSEGKDGSQIVTDQVVCVNGTILMSEKVDTVIVDEGLSKIVYRGTKDMPDLVASRYSLTDMSGQVVGSGNGAAIARYACHYVGLPYVWGGSSLETGADCGGFVMAVFARFGMSVPRGSYSNFQQIGSLAAAKAGDVIVYPGHVAIYIGGGKVVHERNSRMGCRVDSIYAVGGSFKIYRIVQ